MSRVATFDGMPDPLASDYALSVSPRSATIGQDLAVDRRRRIGVGLQITTSLSFVFDATTYPLWRAWWNNDAAGGTLDVGLTLANGYAAGTYTARFLGGYTAEEMGERWMVRAKVEWVDGPSLSPASPYPRLDHSGVDYAALTDGTIDPQTFDADADALHVLVHITIPEALT